MDSLLANYASSDEDEHDGKPPQLPRTASLKKPEILEGKSGADQDVFLPNSTTKHGGIFNSLPPPKSSLSSSSSSSLFSSVPPPKSSSSSSSSKAKKVVQFRPPTITYAGRVDDDDEDEDEEERQRKRSKASLPASSVSPLLSSMRMPAPKHSATLGALPSASGTGRRSMLETDTQASNTSTVTNEVVRANDECTKDRSSDVVYDYSTRSSGSEGHAYYTGYGSAPDGNVDSHSSGAYDQSNAALSGESIGCYGAYGVGSTAGDVNENPNPGSYEAADYSYGHDQNAGYMNYDASYGDYGNNAQYESNWANVTALPEVSGAIENVLQVARRRGRKDVPPEIVEVKQDELIKNRPREDQVKLTGIAFGPAYQPAPSKGKPTKLHKRKHQIGSLYFDMKQKETELAERRSQGFLSKSQTQAKYGW